MAFYDFTNRAQHKYLIMTVIYSLLVCKNGSVGEKHFFW